MGPLTRKKIIVLRIIDRSFRDKPFYSSSIASEANLYSGTVAHVIRVLRASGMAKASKVKIRRRKVYLYRLTEKFNLEKAMKLFE